MRIKLQLGTIAAALMLSACGGSSGDDGNEVIVPLPPVDGTAETLIDMRAVEVDDQPALQAGWHEGAVFMEIYVRGYKDSDGDGIGDFKGLTSKLDYLQELGIQGIWLMPVNQSSDKNHGYEVVDYRAMESDYGTREDFDEFLAEAHARGIGVIIDYVVNHSSGDNPLFVDADNNAGGKRDWYVWSDVNPLEQDSGWIGYWGPGWHPGTQGYYYGIFQHNMPDFNLHNQEVIDFHHDNLRYWLNAGVDGFRFDAVGQLFENGPGHELQTNQPENLDVLFGLQQLVMEDYSNRYMVCEYPERVTDANGSEGCGSAFSMGGFNHFLMQSIRQGHAQEYLPDYLDYPEFGNLGVILANHDEFAGDRVYEQVQGDLARYKLASTALLTLPGRPFIYYGEEVGMGHALNASGDAKLRAPMSWTPEGGFTNADAPFRNHAGNLQSFNVETEQSDPDSLLNHYKALIQLRKETPALRHGTLLQHKNDEVLAFTRTHADEQVLVALNLSDQAVETRIRIGAIDAQLEPLGGFGSGSAASDSAGDVTLNLPAHAIRLYRY